jgi:hypothetical protein
MAAWRQGGGGVVLLHGIVIRALCLVRSVTLLLCKIPVADGSLDYRPHRRLFLFKFRFIYLWFIKHATSNSEF